ncbi:MAG: hypothetical protein COX57_06590, partial [Alphaproteobacteria bacterium CG_4_10_14_0_2_um_filter_63_37]
AIASIMALGVTKGLDELVHVSEAIRRGDRKVRVRLHRFDEVGRLAQGFNRMLDTVSAGEERIHLLLDSTAEGIYGIDREGLCTFINPAAAQMFGYPQTEALIGKNLHDLTHHTLPDGTPYPRQECRMLWPLASGEGVLVEDEWFWRRDGASFPVSYSSYPIRQGGEITGVVVTFTNITDRVQAEERIRHLAEHDPLTDLPNRTLLTDRMHQAIARARRSGELLGVLFLDLDNFKTINDSLGHEIGDQILCQVGHRLTMCLRDIDTVSRQGGDEFVILLDGIPNADETARLAERILVVLAEPIQIQGLELSITPSIGITLYPNDGHNPSQLIRNADAAMYQAKQSGRNNFQFFTQDLNQRAFARLALENALRRAVERAEFAVYYQPLVDLKTGQISGMEALLRWHHPERGVLAPGEFIQVAEESGVIVPLGMWVLREACRQLQQWRKEGLPPLLMAVNLSGLQLRQPHLAEEVKKALEAYDIEPHWLELELTESVLVREGGGPQEILGKLKTMGVKLAIDDFGTRYSSLAYLKRFAIDRIKIDRSFIQDLPGDEENAAIVRAIVSMAHSLRLEVLAEGIETQGQLNFVRREGCDAAQGYLFSRPLPAAEAGALLTTQPRLIPPSA